MKIYKVQDFVVKGKEVFVGLEDSKSTWKIAVRCERMLIHQVSMEAKYPALIGYLRNRFPECAIHLIYEAGFKGFNLYDRLTEDGIDCVVIPPHMVTEPKVNKVKTDKRDAKRLAYILERKTVNAPFLTIISGFSFTKVPRPGETVNTFLPASALTPSRTAVRLTPSRRHSSDSGGSLPPAFSSPEEIKARSCWPTASDRFTLCIISMSYPHAASGVYLYDVLLSYRYTL